MEYVLGFRIDPKNCNRVVLIEKIKPDFMAGKLNGVGGKIEEGESPRAAMTREFLEETGVEITDWNHYATLRTRGGDIYIYKSFGTLEGIKTTEAEKILTPLASYLPYNALPNVRWLLPMAIHIKNDAATHIELIESY